MKNPTILTLCILWASLSLSFSTTAQNEAKEEPLGTPARYLFPDDYMADPSVHIFEGKVYIYPSHDWESGVTDPEDGNHFNARLPCIFYQRTAKRDSYRPRRRSFSRTDSVGKPATLGLRCRL